jgi:hypothetical protein
MKRTTSRIFPESLGSRTKTHLAALTRVSLKLSFLAGTEALMLGALSHEDGLAGLMHGTFGRWDFGRESRCKAKRQ